MEEKRKAYRVLVGKREGKCTLERLGRRRDNNIKMDVRIMGWSGTDWIHLAEDKNRWRAFVNTVMNHRGSIKC
jgi:hypothetical protein